MNTIKTFTRYALYTLLALVFLVGCSDLMPTDEKFVVIKMQSWEKGTYKYQMSSVKGRGGFFMVSEHLYKQGDTLTLKPN
jgi:hypothetical protein